eukprot:44621-Pleurochrysis_carterae.AAC.3
MRSQPQLAQWVNEAFCIPIKSRRGLYSGLGSRPSSRRYHDALSSLVRACELERARTLLARATESPIRPPHTSWGRIDQLHERSKARLVSPERDNKARLVTSERG